MLNIKYAFLALSKKISFTILTVIQLIFCILLIYASLYFRQYIKSETEKITTIFNNNVVYKIQINDVRKVFTDDVPIKSLESFNNYLKTSNDFNHVSFSDDSIFLPEFKGDNQFIKAPLTNNYNQQKYVLVNAFKIDDKFAEQFKFRTSQGRFLKNEDFNVSSGNQIPVILGSRYENIYKLNDNINCIDTDSTVMQLKVVGFLQKDISFIGNTLLADDLINLNNYIIFPKQILQRTISPDKEKQKQLDNFYKVALYNNIFESCIVFNNQNNSKVNQSLDNIANKAKELQIPTIERISLKKNMEYFNEQYENQERIATTIAVILCLFTSMGIILSILNSIIKRTKEFGIHIMHGGTLANIIMQIIAEVLILTLTAYFVVFNLLNTSIVYKLTLKFDYTVFFQLTIILLIITFIITIVPIVKIRKLEINELIKGGSEL